MQTLISKPSPELYQQAKNLIQSWELVAFPTETIYGLGANALDSDAVQKIFTVKGRPSSNPLIVHIGEKSQIADLAIVENSFQQQIIDKLFPGPVTLLLKKKPGIPEVVTQNPFVGIRMPSNQIANDFLKAVALPIAAPSANISGKPSPTSAPMVMDNVGGKIPLIIDGGDSNYGIESTVIKVDEENNQWKIWILRPGFITKEDLESFFEGQPVSVEYTSKDKNLSPGTRFRHYSIPGKITIIDHKTELPTSFDVPTAVIATTERFERENFHSLDPHTPFLTKLQRGSESNLASCAHTLFQFYHDCEKAGIQTVFIQRLTENGLGFAIMNRVKRSAEN